MADIKISELDELASPSDADQLAIVTDIGGGVLATKKITYTNLVASSARKIRGHISSPNLMYAIAPQIILARADADLTISRIHITLSTAAHNIQATLKFANDAISFASSTTIDVVDTTSGLVTITAGFDDATVPSGKYIYLLFDAEPNENIDYMYIEVFYTYD